MFSLFSTCLTMAVTVMSVHSVTVLTNNETLIAEEIINSLGPRSIRPVLNSSTVVHVGLSFVLTQIIELNDILQELKVAGWFTMDWMDERISWNASDYGVDCVLIPLDDIWIPDVILDNNVDEEYNQFLPDTPVKVCSDGRATYTAYSIFQSSCNINIELFPYDSQACKLRFSSWIHGESEVDIQPLLRFLDQEDQFKDNGVWTLQSVDARTIVENHKPSNKPFVYAVFTIHLLRRHEFYLLFILIPYFFCSVLICLMFFVPFESGEKLSYGITAVLGMIVFQEIIAFALPPVGNHSSAVGKYFTSVICIGIISVFVEIVAYNICMQGNLYKASVYIVHYCQIKSNSGSNNNYQMGNIGETPTEQESKEREEETIEHTRKLQAYCASFDLYFGLLCLFLISALMLWFVIKI